MLLGGSCLDIDCPLFISEPLSDALSNSDFIVVDALLSLSLLLLFVDFSRISPSSILESDEIDKFKSVLTVFFRHGSF